MNKMLLLKKAINIIFALKSILAQIKKTASYC